MQSLYTLVVIDMQTCFEAAVRDKTIAAVQNEINNAIEKNAPIIFVEYLSEDGTRYPTDERLFNLVSDYDSVFIALKDEDDGHKPILEILVEYELPSSLRVCGVNTNHCVYYTVAALNRLLPLYWPESDIVVVAEACDAIHSAGHVNALNRLSYLANVRVED